MQDDGFVRAKGPRRGSQMRTRQTKKVMGETSGEASQNQETAHEKPLQLRDEELANPMDNITSEMEQGDSEAQTSSQGDGRVLSLA
ncbi:hypothetical protein F2Q69_00010353 [Brassica cretica]|uniref:Uncharacterized protein n=1 Tax=Brassica cretica TaxID=69181 RepID=A0A8S9QZK2_BRACR|nr:hypothetical protein F2Q69_00010353 [Brassica cretica]